MEGLKCTVGVTDSKIFIDEFDVAGRMMRQFLDAKDEAVKDALCKLGWTPPEEKAKEEPIEVPICEWCKKPMLPYHFCGPFNDKEFSDLMKRKRGARGAVGTVLFEEAKENITSVPVNKLIHEAFRTLTHAVHANAVEHGWFDTEMPNKEMEFLVGMAGVMKECGEALEVVSAKEWDVMDEKCPQHTKLSIELADVVLRLLTLCGQHGINIGAAITAKHEFNRSRPYRHGGKAF